MATVERELTPEERDLAAVFATVLTGFVQVQEAATVVRDAGGDCRSAFLSIFTDDTERANAAQHWPMLSLVLGV